MIFSDRTVEILKNFAGINQSVVFDKGTMLRTIAPSKTIFAKAEVCEIDADFAIYDLPRFLNIMSLMKQPKVLVKDKNIVISSEGKKVTYAIASRDTIVCPPNKDIVINDPVISFHLNEKDLDSVLKAKAVLSLPEIVFVGEEGKIKVRATNTSDPTSDFYDVEVGETCLDFFVIYKSENFRFISSDYDVKIIKGLVTEFSSKDVTYWIAAQSSSVIGSQNG